MFHIKLLYQITKHFYVTFLHKIPHARLATRINCITHILFVNIHFPHMCIVQQIQILQVQVIVYVLCLVTVSSDLPHRILLYRGAAAGKAKYLDMVI